MKEDMVCVGVRVGAGRNTFARPATPKRLVAAVWAVWLTLGLALGLSGTAQAYEVLGVGTGALLGGDLTDPEDDGDPEANVGYNAIFTSTDEPGFGGGEFSFNVFDNRVGGGNDKWCCNAVGADGHQLTAEFDQPWLLTHFTITSGNDCDWRDPSVWEIQGSNDGVNFDTIFGWDTPGSAVWTARLQVVKFSNGEDYTTAVGYKYFRYDVQNTRGGGGYAEGEQHQLNEIEYFGGLPVPAYTWDGTPVGNWGTDHWNAPDGEPQWPNADIGAIIDTDGALVQVEADHAAYLLQLRQGEVSIAAGKTLDVTTSVKGTAIGLQNNAQLIAGSGGTAEEIALAGNAALDTGAGFATALIDDGATAGVFGKKGAGDLQLVSDESDLGVTTLQIEAGTMTTQGADPLAGSTNVVLSGGVLWVGSSFTSVASGGLAGSLADNTGAAAMTSAAVPEPSTLAALLTAAAAGLIAHAWRRRRRR